MRHVTDVVSVKCAANSVYSYLTGCRYRSSGSTTQEAPSDPTLAGLFAIEPHALAIPMEYTFCKSLSGNWAGCLAINKPSPPR